MADNVQIAREASGPADEPSGGSAQFGLTTATALIVGSIIGVGIFNLPTSLAGYGPITLVSMGLTTVGLFALAWCLREPARQLPADGGPHASRPGGLWQRDRFCQRLVVLDHCVGG